MNQVKLQNFSKYNKKNVNEFCASIQTFFIKGDYSSKDYWKFNSPFKNNMILEFIKNIFYDDLKFEKAYYI